MPPWSVIRNEVDDFGVSRFAARVERPGTEADFNRYVKLARDWEHAIPETFPHAYCVNAPPANPFVDPPRVPTPPHGPYKLFEDFTWPWRGATVLGAEYRNVLELLVTRKPDYFELRYRLHSALTASVLDVTRQGGPDVDSGHFTVALDRSAGKLAMSASKAIRFSEAAPFHDELNAVALPFLEFFISEVLLAPPLQ